MKKIFLSFFFIFIFLSVSYAAVIHQFNQDGISKIVITWTSNASGVYTATTDSNGYPLALNGKLEKISFKHGTATNLYDMTITDELGNDILKGDGADINTSTITEFVPMIRDKAGDKAGKVSVNGNISVNLTNAGNASSGTIAIYYSFK